MIDPELLRTFIAVVEQGELKKAAQQVHRSQAAVSMQLKRLETQLGCSLMERNNQGIRLTASGETLLGFAHQLLALNQQTLAAMHPVPLRARLRFGIPSDYAHTFTREFIPLLQAALPEVDAHIRCAPSRRLREQLQRGELDVIIVSGESAQEPHPLLWSEPQRWVAPRHWRHDPDASLPVALLDTDCIARDQMLTLLQQSGCRWHSVFSSVQLDNLATAVDAGLAIALLPEQLINPTTMQRLDDPRLPDRGLITMHLILCDQLSEGVRQAVTRCMNQLVESLKAARD